MKTNKNSIAVEAVGEIIKINRAILEFWASSDGWSPAEAFELISRSRLDLQVELSEALYIWINEPKANMYSAHLILAWVNLGALVEGSMKWFLSVYFEDYLKEEPFKDKNGKPISPEILKFDQLRFFFKTHVWVSADSWDSWLAKIQYRRNAIHAYKHRELGSHSDFLEDVLQYSNFLSVVDGRVPYP